MGGTLQMQCGSGNVLVRSVLLLIYFVPVSELLAVATRISGRTDRSDVPPAANVLCPFCRTAGTAGTAYAII